MRHLATRAARTCRAHIYLGAGSGAQFPHNAEIHGPTNENEVVYRALDLEATEVVQERTDEAGTRPRAVYWLSRQHPECMIAVVSHVGSIR
jgi:hypothetical protein